MGVGCHSLLQGVFLTPRSSQGLLHWRQILYHLSCRGSPSLCLSDIRLNTQKQPWSQVSGCWSTHFQTSNTWKYFCFFVIFICFLIDEKVRREQAWELTIVRLPLSSWSLHVGQTSVPALYKKGQPKAGINSTSVPYSRRHWAQP